MAVLVLDRKKLPLMPCTPKRARKLLASGRARVHRLFPFCIRLVDRRIDHSSVQPLRLSLDPGSKTTGLAISRIAEATDTEGVFEPVMHVVFLMELAHRGQAIMESLHARSAMRRRRRGNLRYRAPRFSNRTRPKGWLAPSLQHRIDTTAAWVARFRRLAPITHLAQELVRFDMQLLQNPEISGVAYQQGTLAGYEMREYLLEKCHRTCAYCDAKDVPLQIEHIQSKARGGSDRVANLTLACGSCNRKKAAQDIRDSRLNKYGFPRAYLTRKKTAFGFRTGDMVAASVPAGKNKGEFTGRVAVRMTGNFNIQSGLAGVSTVQGILHKHCRVLQRADGYGYVWKTTQFEKPKARTTTASRSAPFHSALGVFRSKI